MNLKNKLSIFLSCALLYGALGTLAAVEIPLEGYEKPTKVAFVNMHKIFEAFPDTEKSRAELIKMIEERKSEITVKREEVAQLKGEIDFLKQKIASILSSTMPVIQPSTLTEKKIEEEMKQKREPQPITSLGALEKTPLKAIFLPPEKSTSVPEAAVSTPIEVSTPAATAVSTGPAVLVDLRELQTLLESKQELLTKKQTDLEAFVGGTEQEVKDLQQGKTMALMSKIYKSLEEIAAKDGYSIILDKDTILYGESTSAVDITDSLLFRLSGKLKP